jgi:serine/threonine protein kinase
MRLAADSEAIVAEEVIGGYRLVKHMITGQTSQVWEVVEGQSGRHFAMKLLLPERVSDPEHRRLLIHEAQVGGSLAHPNVIKIIAFSANKENPYLVMEFFPAGNLRLRITRKETDFIRDRCHSIVKQAATGLAFMNAKGWVHRDVKPDNFLVNGAGELRIIDFALSTRVQKSSFFGRLFRRKSRAMGTRSYMSPEQIRGEPVDGRADIYSFGATCYELVTGRPPFRGMSSHDLLTKQLIEKPVSPQTYNPDVTDQFAELVMHMLQKKKQDRPKDFHEVLMALRTMRVFKSEAPQPTME